MHQLEATLNILYRYKRSLTKQQLRTLCGQAKAGNTEAALKGLQTILEREGIK